MNPLRDIEQAFDRIALYDVRSYLTRTGWKSAFVDNKKWQIYKLENSLAAPIELILPAEDRFTDTRDRIRQLLTSLAQIEGRNLSDVCAEIVGINSDSLLIRLQIPGTSATIPIDAAPRHVKAIRNLVLYSACSEVDAKPHYEQPPSNPSDLIASFEFCHTFKGSFGFEVSSVVAKPKQTDHLFESPKQRKIVERIIRGLVLLDNAVRNGNPDILINSYEQAFNAKMCDSIADIGLVGEIPFNFGIQWASSIPPAEDVKNFQEQSIGEPQVSILKYVSEQLKIVKPHPDEIVGSVINLHCVNNPTDDHSKRVVALRVAHQKYGSIEVKMTLGSDRYLMAIDAHTKGKQILARGQLQRNGNSWTIEAITLLETKT